MFITTRNERSFWGLIFWSEIHFLWKLMFCTLTRCSVLTADNPASPDGSWCPFRQQDFRLHHRAFWSRSNGGPAHTTVSLYENAQILLAETCHMVHSSRITTELACNFNPFSTKISKNIIPKL